MPTLNEKYRFTASDGVTPTVVTPLDGWPRYRWERIDDGKFFRKKLANELTFAKADYTYFKALYDAADCTKITLLIERYCGGAWVTDYEGKIAIAEGEYNLSRCEVTYTVNPDDVYECINRNIEKPQNWLIFRSAVTLKSVYGTVETITCIYNGAEFGSTSIRMFYKQCWSGGTFDINTGFTPDPSLAWRPITHDQHFDTPTAGQLQITTTWARETVTQVATPPGVGWINLGSNVWVRPVLYGATTERWTEDRYQFSAEVSNLDIDNARVFNSTLESLVETFDCVDGVVSDFFGINPDGTAPTNDAYTFASDHLQNLLLFQKSDVVRSTASGNAITLEMTLKDLLEDLRRSLNVYWGITTSGGNHYLRIEHWSYFEGTNGLDLTTLDGGKYIAGSNRFRASENVPAVEKFAYQESFSDDFLGKVLSYPEGCADDRTIDYSCRVLSADFGGLLENDSAGLTGIVLVSTYDDGSGGYLIDNLNDEANGAFAWREVLPALWAFGRYNGTLSSTAGTVTVQSVRKRKSQGPIKVKFCCDDFEPTELVNTALGWGEVKDAELDTETNTLTLNLFHT